VATNQGEPAVNEHQLQDALGGLLREIALMEERDASALGVPDDLVNLRRVRTYQDDGVLTNNAGLVVTTADGSEFEITIVRSR
jgi:hypothetical protein